MNEQFSQIREVVLSMFTDTTAAVITFLPKLIAAVAVLLVGWLLARLVSAVLERSVRGAGSMLCSNGPEPPRHWRRPP